MKLYKESIAYASKILVVKEERFPYNEFPFHYHPEFELILIMNGSGQRFIGNTVGEFNSGDLYLLGPNLPHTFHNKHLPGDRSIHQIVIQFYGDFLGKNFFDQSPFKRIKACMDQSTRGYQFTGKTLQQVTQRIMPLPRLDEAAVVIQLLAILDILSRSTEFSFISTPGQGEILSTADSERMNAIYSYVFDNFQEDITLRDVASVACLSPEAFCRYFKKYTRKTFSEFLVEFRIGFSCKLLLENKLSVSEVSRHCGFNSISYFNRKFKSITGKTPVEYTRSASMEAAA
jgi:AraC-like DNA-binding protein